MLRWAAEAGESVEGFCGILAGLRPLPPMDDQPGLVIQDGESGDDPDAECEISVT